MSSLALFGGDLQASFVRWNDSHLSSWCAESSWNFCSYETSLYFYFCDPLLVKNIVVTSGVFLLKSREPLFLVFLDSGQVYCSNRWCVSVETAVSFCVVRSPFIMTYKCLCEVMVGAAKDTIESNIRVWNSLLRLVNDGIFFKLLTLFRTKCRQIRWCEPGCHECPG